MLSTLCGLDPNSFLASIVHHMSRAAVPQPPQFVAKAGPKRSTRAVKITEQRGYFQRQRVEVAPGTTFPAVTT